MLRLLAEIVPSRLLPFRFIQPHFPQVLFNCKVTYIVKTESDFYLWFQCFVLLRSDIFVRSTVCSYFCTLQLSFRDLRWLCIYYTLFYFLFFIVLLLLFGMGMGTRATVLTFARFKFSFSEFEFLCFVLHRLSLLSWEFTLQSICVSCAVGGS